MDVPPNLENNYDKHQPSQLCFLYEWKNKNELMTKKISTKSRNREDSVKGLLKYTYTIWDK